MDDQQRVFPSYSLDEVHYRIMDLIGDLAPAKALDLPAGPGRLSWFLHQKGFDVVAGDIQPGNFVNPEIPVAAVDGNDHFPFAAGAFDYAFCIDGPEHFENLYHLFREFARILTPGGRLIVSYPNYSNIESRLRTIFYGVLEPVTSVAQLRTEFAGNPGMVHLNRCGFAMLKMALEFAGFRLELISGEKCKKNQLALLPLYALIWMFSRVKGKKGEAKYWLRDSNSYAVLMGGNDLILRAVRTDPEAEADVGHG